MQTIYVGNTLINDFFLGNQRIDDILYFTQSIIPTNGLMAWFNGNSYTSGSNTWNSFTGSVAGTTASLAGATSLPAYVSSTGSFRFSDTQTFSINNFSSFDLNSSSFTVIVAGRFSGSVSLPHGRLLVGATHGFSTNNFARNWYLGTYGTNTNAYGNSAVGVVFNASGSYDTNWRIYTAVNDRNTGSTYTSSFYSNAVLLGAVSGSANTNIGPRSFGINSGSFCGGTAGGAENNNCEVGDILIYNRALSNIEISSIQSILSPKYAL